MCQETVENGRSVMKILVVSDTHGTMYHLERLLYQRKDFSRILHLGDIQGEACYLQALAECPVDIVAGNNDYDYDLPHEKIITVGGHTIFMAHGHAHMVNYGMDRLLTAAIQRGASLAIFGHTHRPFLDETKAVTLLNPGSISLPRQANRLPSYAVLDIDREGRMHISIEYVE